MKKYHYEYFCYTDNLNYGRTYLGQSRSRDEANRIGKMANKGLYIIERKRVEH